MAHKVNQEDLAEAIRSWEYVMGTDWFKERPKDVRELYMKYPPWKFYTDKEGIRARRVYSVSEYNGKLRLEVATAMMGWTNLVVGGVDPNDLVEVECYPDGIVERFVGNPDADNFKNASGYLAFVALAQDMQ